MPVIRAIINFKSDTYKLCAENPRFEDYEVNKVDVKQLYQIKGIIRREVF